MNATALVPLFIVAASLIIVRPSLTVPILIGWALLTLTLTVSL